MFRVCSSAVRAGLALIAVTALFNLGCDEPTAPAGSAPGERTDGSPPSDGGPARDGALHIDGGASLGVGEACDADEACAAGVCVHGVCSTRCGVDEDCGEGLLCATRGGALRCTARCETADDCAAGLVCAVRRAHEGFCVAPGAAAPGEWCDAPEDCTSWVCSGERCLARCGAGGICPTGEVCLPLHTEAICVPAGPGEDEDACGQGNDCASGVCRGGRCTVACRPGEDCPNDRVCLSYPQLALCERRCATSADCGPTGVCRAAGAERLCATRGRIEAGEACTDHRDCASGRCDDGVCLHACDDQIPCPAGTACVRELSGAACRPAGAAPIGASCEGGADCASGFCASGRCGTDCAGEAPCPDGMRCGEFSDGAFCFPACRRDEDCPSVAYCEATVLAEPVCFWRGANEAGEACQRDADCASGRCADDECLAACPDGQCPAGMRCVDFDTAAWCSPPTRPVGAACDAAEGDCDPDLLCTAGRCLPGCDAGCPPRAVCHDGRCHPGCATDDDCRPGRLCNPFDQGAPFCQARGEAESGTTCLTSGECASGLCFHGRCGARCADGCAEQEACVRLGGHDHCLPAGARTGGQPCVVDGTCASGLCVGRRCAEPCGPGGVCPIDVTCAALRAGQLCVWGCDVLENAGCAADEVCDPAGDFGEGRCALPGGGAPPGGACDDIGGCAAGAVTCLYGFCRGPCALDGSGTCGAGWICTRLSPEGTVGACVPAGDLPHGALRNPGLLRERALRSRLRRWALRVPLRLRRRVPTGLAVRRSGPRSARAAALVRAGLRRGVPGRSALPIGCPRPGCLLLVLVPGEVRGSFSTGPGEPGRAQTGGRCQCR